MNTPFAHAGLTRMTAGLLAALAVTAVHAQTPRDPGAVPPASSSSASPTPPSSGPSTTVWGSTYDGSDYSLLPYTKRGYVGINLGQSDYSNECPAGFTCENPNVAGSVYTGGMFNDWLGVELGYLNMGRAERAGGRTEAQGLNVSLVARLPMQAFNVFVKGGSTYGRTKVTADALSLVSEGTDSGWGASYGAGVGYDFSPATSLVLEWGRHDFHFASAGKDDVTLTSLGLKYRF